MLHNLDAHYVESEHTQAGHTPTCSSNSCRWRGRSDAQIINTVISKKKISAGRWVVIRSSLMGSFMIEIHSGENGFEEVHLVWQEENVRLSLGWQMRGNCATGKGDRQHGSANEVTRGIPLWSEIRWVTYTTSTTGIPRFWSECYHLTVDKDRVQNGSWREEGVKRLFGKEGKTSVWRRGGPNEQETLLNGKDFCRRIGLHTTRYCGLERYEVYHLLSWVYFPSDRKYTWGFPSPLRNQWPQGERERGLC